MRTRFIQAAAVAWLVAALWLPAPAQIIHVDHGPNAPEQQKKHYVILVSLDGFRYDYAKKYGATNLLRLAAEGASAPEGMIPSFPSVTFPNHYSMITGLYPEHHGIVANSFYDPARKQTYAADKVDSVSDGSWYGGEPIWLVAEKLGMRTACFFWPTSDADVEGMHPSYYLHYDRTIPNEQRIEQVIAWLKLPPEQRPHFLTLYFADTDHVGHESGPESPQIGETVRQVDALMGKLVAELKTLSLPVDLIIVSDHGMATVEGNWIDLDHYTDLSQFVTVGSLLYAPDEEAAARAYRQLRGASDKFVVYRRANVPAYLHFNANPRIGDPVVIATGPYVIRAHASETPEVVQPSVKGQHGYDPSKMKSMRAIFYAAGPDISPGVTVSPFENVDVYPLIAKILGLEVGHVDGQLEPLRPILRETVKGPQPSEPGSHATATASHIN